jgi:hypothetical protein
MIYKIGDKTNLTNIVNKIIAQPCCINILKKKYRYECMSIDPTKNTPTQSNDVFNISIVTFQ